MKNKFFTFILIALIYSTANSQSLKYGLKAGMNISKFSSNTNDPYSDYNGRVGFHLGGLLEVPLNDKFSIQPELLCSFQGANINYGERKFTLNYLQLPILGKYYIINGLSAEAGPVLGYLISAKYNATLTSEGGRETVDVTENYKSIDVGLGLGASYKLKSDLFFGLRYNFGILDINDDSVKDSKIKNNVFQISVGYLF
ncbi:porin family protein [Aequorivita lipolytica]|uniref:PorT family protein n=1 Tax=Aequorivita lipolytica TaxID=153267 RepID=A0A5C6YMC5_9FLAO|nr:porin family protein [Aequorivita lipolytica]TXD68376.1 PorT family protein [Aequorivita lipolytica]SRX51481.1 hypothetical protein AEQU2_01964 [Aequorivita lipolytica]